MKKSLNRRITVYFLIIMAVTVVVSAMWNYYSTRRSILDMEREQAKGCASAVSTLLDHYGDALGKAPESEEYSFLWHAIHNFCRGFFQDALYIYAVDAGSGERRLLMEVDSDVEPDLPPKLNEDAFQLPESGVKEAEADLLSDEDSIRRVVRNKNSGAAILWIARYPGSDDAGEVFLCMEYNINLEKGHILSDFLADILLPIFALGIAFLILNLMIRRRVAVPIRLISDRMKGFAQNSRQRPAPLHIPYQDEIGEIASSFEKMTEEITTYISNIEQLTEERVETNVQLDIARRIQYGLVPEKITMKEPSFRISAMTRPAKAVGGDFYDCFRREDGAICIVMGDVSGKGITGAIFMAMIKTIIREKLAAGLSPARTLNQANAELIAQNPEGFFATVFVAILDPSSGSLQYANAGHTNPVLLGPGASLLKPETGIAIGLFEDAEIRDAAMTLTPGQGIVLYTDGVTDALNAQRVPFGTDRLLETLNAEVHAQEPAEEALRRVSSAVDAFCEGVEPFDDMAVLVLCLTDGAEADLPQRLSHTD